MSGHANDPPVSDGNVTGRLILDRIDFEILLALSRAVFPVTQTQLSMATTPRISERTIGPRLSRLREAGLVYRPLGPRTGEMITDRGREELKKLIAITSDSLRKDC
jgi:repressor of nif and glnA expression